MKRSHRRVLSVLEQGGTVWHSNGERSARGGMAYVVPCTTAASPFQVRQSTLDEMCVLGLIEVEDPDGGPDMTYKLGGS